MTALAIVEHEVDHLVNEILDHFPMLERFLRLGVQTGNGDILDFVYAACRHVAPFVVRLSVLFAACSDGEQT